MSDDGNRVVEKRFQVCCRIVEAFAEVRSESRRHAVTKTLL